MAAHTPGPWHVDADREFIVVDDSHNPADIACSDMDGAVGIANAKLMAASPELLAACQDLSTRLGRLSGHRDDLDAIESARLAIVKAIGEDR